MICEQRDSKNVRILFPLNYVNFNLKKIISFGNEKDALVFVSMPCYP